MGLSRTADQFSAKLRATEKALSEQGDRKSLLPVARTVEQTLIRSAATAGLHKGSRIAGRPWRGTYIRNHGTRELAVGYANPAQLVNSRTKPHVVGARGLGTKRRIGRQVQGSALIGFLTGTTIANSFRPRSKGAKALHWSGGFAAYVKSPGTHGKRFYERAKPTAVQEGGKAMQQSVTRALSRIYG